MFLLPAPGPARACANMYICVCHAITDRQIRRAVDHGASSLTEVQNQLPVGGCCGRCEDSARALIREHLQQDADCEIGAAVAA